MHDRTTAHLLNKNRQCLWRHQFQIPSWGATSLSTPPRTLSPYCNHLAVFSYQADSPGKTTRQKFTSRVTDKRRPRVVANKSRAIYHSTRGGNKSAQSLAYRTASDSACHSNIDYSRTEIFSWRCTVVGTIATVVPESMKATDRTTFKIGLTS